MVVDGEKSITQFHQKTPLTLSDIFIESTQSNTFLPPHRPHRILKASSVCPLLLPAVFTSAISQLDTQLRRKTTLHRYAALTRPCQVHHVIYPPLPPHTHTHTHTHTHLISIQGLIAMCVCCCYCGGIARQSLHWSLFVLQPVY